MKKNLSNIFDYLLSNKIEKANKLIDKLDRHFNINEDFSEEEKYYIRISNEKSSKPFVPPAFLSIERERLFSVLKNFSEQLNITAPTSFGKSYIVVQHILKNENTAIIVTPTLSLANEYYLNLRHKHKHNKNVTMSPIDNAQIYVLTPEKTLQLFDVFPNKRFDVVVFDEFYEAFEHDRFSNFDDAFTISKMRSQKMITIVPKSVRLDSKYTKGQKFETTASATFRRFQKYVYDKKTGITTKFISSEFDLEKTLGFPVEEYNEEIDFNKYFYEKIFKKRDKQEMLREKIIVLTSKKSMYTNIEKCIKNNIEFNSGGVITNLIIEYLKKNSEHALLVEGIKRGVAYHNGDVDKVVRTLIEAAFTKGEIKVLFANSTVTKGVNLAPDVLMIDNYDNQPSDEFEQKIFEVDLANTFGRTGRTILENTLVGEIIIFTNFDSKKVNYDSHGKRGDSEIYIGKPELKEPLIINSFENAYKKIVATKIVPTISKSQANIIAQYIKKDPEVENNSLFYKEFLSLIIELYKIKFKYLSDEIEAKSIAMDFIFKNGYTRLYRMRRKKLLTKEYWITDNGMMFYKYDNNKKIKEKPKNVNEFIPNTYQEDVILAKCVNDYDKIGGFYFSQLLTILIKKCIQDKLFDEDVIERYFERQSEEETIASQKGWPESFGTYFIYSKKNKDVEDFLNRSIEAIMPK